jgi:hypothetical protein
MVAVLVFLALGCGPRVVQGPQLASDPPVIGITIEPTSQNLGRSVRIIDRTAIDSALKLLSRGIWWENHDELIPTHRIQLVRADGKVLTYWIGDFSNPPRFPCYQFCSGSWAAASSPDGKILPRIIKPLATTGDMFALDDLLEPSEPNSQPNPPLQPTGQRTAGG